MQGKTAVPIGATLGFPPDDAMETDWSDVLGPSNQDALVRDGYITATVGPTAKERERARIHEGRRRTARVSRPATRARGAGRPKVRGASRRSSAKSGDSGDDSDSSEPASRRLCGFCGKDIPADRSPKATHCSDKHAARDRKRRQRRRERERAKLPAAPITAADRRMYELDDDGWTKLWELAVCRCNGHHLELEPGWCTRCGHHLPRELDDGAERYAAFMKRLAEPTVVQRLVERYREQVAR